MGKMIENYSLLNEIGRGMYSTVFRAINIKTKQEVAIKVVKADKFKQYPKLEEGTYNQINILNNLEGCPHIIKYYDMLKTVNNFYFVYEYCNGGTLETLLREKGILPETAALTYFQQIVQAFKVLKKNNIMHRDLKPENLLLHDGQIKLADFGFCKPLESEDEMSKTMLGSPIYMAPQILKGEGYSIKSDIWSLGVVLFRMVFGFCPFESNNIGKLIMIIEEEQMVIPQDPVVSPELVKLLKRMLTKNPSLRADWAEVFAYEVRNGELIRQGLLRPKTPTGLLKRSFTMSETTKASMQNSMRLRTQHQKSEVLFHPKANQEMRTSNNQEVKSNTNQEMRSTFSGKSPFSQNFKKDILMKNHQKCIELMSLSVGLGAEQCSQSLILCQLLNMGLHKQLKNLLESAKKQSEIKPNDLLIKNLIDSVEWQLEELNNIIIFYKTQFSHILNHEIEELLSNNKKHMILEFMQAYVSKLKLEEMQQLVLICRVVDYLTQSLVIRKETFEKMSREKLLTNLKIKLEQSI